jgi:diguanylate cyclase (GGDEF)-like protein
MRFYRATSFLFPRHYEWRILLICFGAVHLPLIATVLFQAVTGHWQVGALLVLLAATLGGTVLGVVAIRALLAPVREATAMLRSVQNGECLGRVPSGGDDLVGHLLTAVATSAAANAARTERLIEAAERDALTGLRNRRGFLDSSERILIGEGNAVIAMIDIDHFKSVNDRFGHSAGDALLRAVGQRLERGLRHSDLAARWGGEEFVVLLPDTQLDEARLVMERLRANVALDPLLGPESTGNTWPVTFSCGLAPLRSFAQLGDATHRADAALYAAKNNGRNRVHVADNG